MRVKQEDGFSRITDEGEYLWHETMSVRQSPFKDVLKYQGLSPLVLFLMGNCLYGYYPDPSDKRIGHICRIEFELRYWPASGVSAVCSIRSMGRFKEACKINPYNASNKICIVLYPEEMSLISFGKWGRFKPSNGIFVYVHLREDLTKDVILEHFARAGGGEGILIEGDCPGLDVEELDKKRAPLKEDPEEEKVSSLLVQVCGRGEEDGF
jgi:hypothetical protein